MQEEVNDILRDEHIIIGEIMAKFPDIAIEERQKLDNWLTREGNRELFETITNNENRLQKLKEYFGIYAMRDNTKEKLLKIIGDVPGSKVNSKIIWWSSWKNYIAAACIILLVSTGAVLWFNGNFGSHKEGQVAKTEVINDAAPGKFKAKLILDNGSIVILDSAKSGQLETQGRTAVINRDGKLEYVDSSGSDSKGNNALYNTLMTSKGEIYATVLSDGSKIWLNSESSIRYPVSFDGNERKVEITGEAYFEVAHNASKPFIVTGSGLSVTVLGTKFNVNSYHDQDATKITLLEGLVKVSHQSQEAFIRPGEQAIVPLSTNEKVKIDKDADIEQVMAWKNGSFQFNGESLEAVMKQLERWYDVETVYQNKDTSIRLLGMISRNTNLREVLKALELSGVHFRIEGKKIIVLP